MHFQLVQCIFQITYLIIRVSLTVTFDSDSCITSIINSISYFLYSLGPFLHPLTPFVDSGLVGEGVSRLFFCSGYENSSSDAVSTTLGNTFGIFLRKVDIIRDFLEDYDNGRTFWPQEVIQSSALEIVKFNLFLMSLFGN